MHVHPRAVWDQLLTTVIRADGQAFAQAEYFKLADPLAEQRVLLRHVANARAMLDVARKGD